MADEDAIDAVLAAVGRSPDDRLASAAARARSRRRWLRQQAAESSTMAGVLLTLAERGLPVTVRAGRWAHRGRLDRVTSPLAVMALPEPDGAVALLPTALITAVESSAPVNDDRSPGGGPDLAAVLATVAADRPPVRLQLGDGTEVVGTLAEVGVDVAVVRLASSVMTVRLSAIQAAVVPGLRPGARTE